MSGIARRRRGIFLASAAAILVSCLTPDYTVLYIHVRGVRQASRTTLWCILLQRG